MFYYVLANKHIIQLNEPIFTSKYISFSLFDKHITNNPYCKEQMIIVSYTGWVDIYYILEFSTKQPLNEYKLQKLTYVPSKLYSIVRNKKIYNVWKLETTQYDMYFKHLSR